MKEFGEKLRELREEKGISPEKLAEEFKKINVPMSANSIRNYENGVFPKSANTYNDLAKYFNVAPNYLFDENIENKTYENIEISNILNLSDSSIEKLKKIDNNGINYFIENVDLSYLSQTLNIYSKTKKVINDFEIFSELIEIDKYISNEDIEKLKNKLSVFDSIYNNILEIFELHKTFNQEETNLNLKRLVETYNIIKDYITFRKNNFNEIIHSILLFSQSYIYLVNHCVTFLEIDEYRFTQAIQTFTFKEWSSSKADINSLSMLLEYKIKTNNIILNKLKK